MLDFFLLLRYGICEIVFHLFYGVYHINTAIMLPISP